MLFRSAAVANLTPFRYEIHVAQGTYAGGVAFFQPAALYGGFPSGGGDFSARDWMAHPTIIAGGSAGNPQVVLFDGQSTTIGNESALDGFTLENGDGLTVFDASPVLQTLNVCNNTNSGI